MDREQVLVVQETEYTGAGKHPIAQLAQARALGVELRRGDPRDNRPGRCIVVPEAPEQIAVVDLDLDAIRDSYLRKALAGLEHSEPLGEVDRAFLAVETRLAPDRLDARLEALHAAA
jgi:hypothetical protein